ncbi:MAG: DUF3618 domain-containing protein [Beutenbergiaceae bacterium]
MSAEQEEPKTRKRSAAEIEADLKRAREELTNTVDEISGRLDPRTQVKAAKEQGQQFIADIKAGEPKAVKVVGIAAATLAAVVGLAILRRKR